MLKNPFPNKRVDTIDIFSKEQIASYDIYAATVVQSDPRRPVTQPTPLDWPEQKFDGRLTVRVLDQNEHPIAGAWVYPDLSIPNARCSTVATPLYTSNEGTGVVKFPTDHTWCIIFNVTKEGWHTVSEEVILKEDGASKVGFEYIIHLSPDSVDPGAGEEANSLADAGKSADSSATGDVSPAESEASGNAAAPGPKATGPRASHSGRNASFRPSPILLIPAPVGSKVRIEFSDTLAQQDWKPLTTITVTSSPFAFVCGQEDGPLPRSRFYRAAILPQE